MVGGSKEEDAKIVMFNDHARALRIAHPILSSTIYILRDVERLHP